MRRWLDILLWPAVLVAVALSAVVAVPLAVWRAWGSRRARAKAVARAHRACGCRQVGKE